MSEGTMRRDGNETWYRIVGDLESGPTPVVICHGGPGAAHDYAEPIADLFALRARLRPVRPGGLREVNAPPRRAG